MSEEAGEITAEEPTPVERETYDATCADCGKPCKVPFKPKPDRPVYCQECFRKRRTFRRGRFGRFGRFG